MSSRGPRSRPSSATSCMWAAISVALPPAVRWSAAAKLLRADDAVRRVRVRESVRVEEHRVARLELRRGSRRAPGSAPHPGASRRRRAPRPRPFCPDHAAGAGCPRPRASPRHDRLDGERSGRTRPCRSPRGLSHDRSVEELQDAAGPVLVDGVRAKGVAGEGRGAGCRRALASDSPSMTSQLCGRSRTSRSSRRRRARPAGGPRVDGRLDSGISGRLLGNRPFCRVSETYLAAPSIAGARSSRPRGRAPDIDETPRNVCASWRR